MDITKEVLESAALRIQEIIKEVSSYSGDGPTMVISQPLLDNSISSLWDASDNLDKARKELYGI